MVNLFSAGPEKAKGVRDFVSVRFSFAELSFANTCLKAIFVSSACLIAGSSDYEPCLYCVGSYGGGNLGVKCYRVGSLTIAAISLCLSKDVINLVGGFLRLPVVNSSQFRVA